LTRDRSAIAEPTVSENGSMSGRTAPAPSATLDARPLTALCLGWFIVIVDATIVNVALPSMAGDLRASVSGLEWVLDGYTVTFAGLLLAGGSAADRWGARRVFDAGLAVFAPPRSDVRCRPVSPH
jgi:DHA2 family methylenomycin A resistance protein-like MFS transporter